MQVSNKEFDELVDAAVGSINKKYLDRMQSLAILVADEPTIVQREQLRLHDNQTLFGLYEGVPLPVRNGASKLLPDKITLFKNPLLTASSNRQQLSENIRHTIWHEVAHYFGLDHNRIGELDK